MRLQDSACGTLSIETARRHGLKCTMESWVMQVYFRHSVFVATFAVEPCSLNPITLWLFRGVQGERYIGSHGPAIRDAAGWKLIVNGAGGVYTYSQFDNRESLQSWRTAPYRLSLSTCLRITLH